MTAQAELCELAFRPAQRGLRSPSAQLPDQEPIEGKLMSTLAILETIDLRYSTCAPLVQLLP
jgi:hypothetical protein